MLRNSLTLRELRARVPRAAVTRWYSTTYANTKTLVMPACQEKRSHDRKIKSHKNNRNSLTIPPDMITFFCRHERHS